MIEGRNAVVTGSSRGTGRAVAFLMEDATCMTGQTLALDGGIMID